jgi:3-phosphoshikimate 1-carboxyvinyltransferase
VTAAAIAVRASTASGTVQAPGSKSVTHRAFLLAAQSRVACRVATPLLSADTLATLQCLQRMGARVDPFTPDGVEVGFHPAALHAPEEALDCLNSGTTLRLLAATASRFAAPVDLTGDASLCRRPNGPLLEALRSRGVRVRSHDGCAPLAVQGPLRSGAVRIPASASSQFASALLLVLPFVPGDSLLDLDRPVASRPYLDVTLRVAGQAGLRLEARPGDSFSIPGSQEVAASRLEVEGDWSGAAFALVAAAVTQGQVTVCGLDLRSPQGDRAILGHLDAFGAKVDAAGDRVTCRGQGRLHSPGTVDVSGTPDLFPALAVLAACSGGTTTFTGGASLRVKESDRIAAMAEGLRRLGVETMERPDGLVVHGGRTRGARVAAHGDHRIHMAFAVAGLASAGTTHVEDAPCAAVSYPRFHADLARLGARLEPTPAQEAMP